MLIIMVMQKCKRILLVQYPKQFSGPLLNLEIQNLPEPTQLRNDCHTFFLSIFYKFWSIRFENLEMYLCYWQWITITWMYDMYLSNSEANVSELLENLKWMIRSLLNESWTNDIFSQWFPFKGLVWRKCGR